MEGRKLLEIQCFKCNKWYVPKQSSIRDRLRALNKQVGVENHLYCSSECKNSCSVFRKQTKNYLVIYDVNNADKFYTKPELKSWANEVLTRANYICEYCGNLATIGHHIKPKKLEPGIALDPDNGLAVCKNCHHKHCHKNECSTYSLGKIIC
jgi:5-methylcytosine-specific restriction endonuclease McrA